MAGSSILLPYSIARAFSGGGSRGIIHDSGDTGMGVTLSSAPG